MIAKDKTMIYWLLTDVTHLHLIRRRLLFLKMRTRPDHVWWIDLICKCNQTNKREKMSNNALFFNWQSLRCQQAWYPWLSSLCTVFLSPRINKGRLRAWWEDNKPSVDATRRPHLEPRCAGRGQKLTTGDATRPPGSQEKPEPDSALYSMLIPGAWRTSRSEQASAHERLCVWDSPTIYNSNGFSTTTYVCFETATEAVNLVQGIALDIRSPGKWEPRSWMSCRAKFLKLGSGKYFESRSMMPPS